MNAWRRTLAVLLAPTFLASAVPAYAQPAASAPASVADTTRARALFDAGARAYESGQFDAAIQAFEQAYSITPREGLLFSLAQAHRKQHAVTRDAQHLRAAVDAYRRYLGAVKEGARRKDAAEALEQLEPLLGGSSSPATGPQTTKRATIVQITSNTPGAKVSIDGAEAVSTPLTREVTPGVHEVRLSAEGFFDDVQTVEALEGQFLPFTYPLKERPARLEVHGADGAEVAVDGRFLGEAPFAAPLELPAGRRYITVVANGHRPYGEELQLGRGQSRELDVDLVTTAQRDASWVVMISGITIMAAGGAFGVIALAREGDAQEVLEAAATRTITPADVSAYESARVDRDGFAVASVATLAGGGVVSLVGLGLYLFDTPTASAPPPRDGAPTAPAGTEPEAPPAATSLELGFVPTFGPGGGGGALLGRF